MKNILGLSLCGLAAAGCASTSDGGASRAAGSELVLPSAELSAFVAEVEIEGSRALGDEFVDIEVTDVSSDSIYREAVEAAKARGDNGIDQPIQIANELIVLFRPDLSPTDAAQALEDHGLVVIGTMPEIGALVVDCTGALEDMANDTSDENARVLGDAPEEPINRFAQLLMRDARFAAVAVNSVMTSTSIRSAVVPQQDEEEGTRDLTAASPATGESVDWGIAASNVDDVWPLMTQPVSVGVIDVGFAEHVDLPMTPGLQDPWTVNDHGNHVVGIMCARHNGVGIKGVLPGCKAAAATGELLLSGFSPTEDGEVLGFQTRFSEYIGTVLEFMELNPDAKVINISLGYNWMPNFRIDPRLPDNGFVRDLVRSQGRIFQSILAYAKRRDIAIFSAAGNDSTDLSSPLEAEWASPFNFGSKLMQSADGWTNGIIVEAYGQNLKRAKFSNSAGHVSCPGVQIKSSIARPANSYGVMSGTSMASPYCAASFAALRALEPSVSLRQSIDCFLASSSKIDGRIPRMNLKEALETCRDLEPR